MLLRCTAAFVLLLFSNDSTAQEVLFLKPGPADGRDVQIWSYDPANCLDRGTDRHDLVIHQWTKNGTPVSKYSLLRFDLSPIPQTAKIIEASLSLFHCPDSFDQGHSQLSGSNVAVIQRALTPWEEDICWNDIPESSSENQVFLPASSSEDQDYLEINVLDMVQDMISDPIHGNGFIIKMVDAIHYRSLTFASSDHPIDSLHPELKVVYMPVCTKEPEVSLGPDRSICLDDSLILDVYDQEIELYQWQDGSNFPKFVVQEPGLYWVKVRNHCGMDVDSVLVEKRTLNNDSIPNVITPNWDGFNESFELPANMDASLNVYNRWGKQVYQAAHYKNDWTGDYLPVGTYFYIVFDYCSQISNHGRIHIVK